MPGPCWWILTQGKVPTIKVGNTEIPVYPGRGFGWYLWLSMLESQKTEAKNDKDKLIEELIREVAELKKKIEELEKK